ncbi:SRPBCC family protein [Streptomyces sp. NBC_00893]|uniref:SRPBCC family protein n=1 Tax=Streptomyces sp. NBC_00893 TaxID=2975862 RepID=UPI002252F2A0|nr:SRPBCC family protein [Streptomyces sp. NBC_00893]MCX4843776.1 SRPBCC family protein [Streptomyces sp. NBC_00893]
MWTHEHCIETALPQPAVWDCYADPALCPEWDKEVREPTLDGPPAPGVRGTLDLHGLPPTDLTIPSVVPGTALTTEVRIPDSTLLRFTYHLAEISGGTRVTHRAELDGPSAGQESGTSVTAPAPDTMRALIHFTATRAR